VISNSNHEETVKKYAISLDPQKAARMPEEARRAAVKEGRDLTSAGGRSTTCLGS
jgi:hypothetical protein